ncbi:hypothetical protein BIV25_21410 [Streptomyces sp. MUSC 14]|uniref:AAA family ATPase n=1 Tax=Streptomyces sp. MUSC 14 TaxID=1354889 RepID=UPI0008F58FB2|nr:LuxR family transcriptional regulator [Streptomyces sp. MUSC 14]OIJ94937.1 hypothetical protein BIV25_21410 [Streptomyces sp. MUSC 14]
MTPLVERAADLQVLDALLSHVLEGHGTAVLLDAPAGTGKSALLVELTTRARRQKIHVLGARCCPQEASAPWGAVRQLLDARLSDEDLALLEPGHAPLPHGDGDQALPVECFHGLYLALLRLARHTPLVLLVDDAHHADDPSQQWLAYLARRLESAPIGLAIATRSASGAAPGALETALAACPEFSRLRPRPLAEQGTSDNLAERLGQALEAGTAAACHAATGGSPGLLDAVADALIRTGTPAPQVTRKQAADACSRAILRALPQLLGRHGPAVTTVATAVSALGRVAGLPLLARTAGVALSATEEAITALEDAGWVGAGPPWQLRSTAIEQVLTAQAGEHTLSALRSRAAEVLRDLGAGTPEIADMLLLTTPDGQTWRVPVLREAARIAEERSDMVAAGAYLRRALAEPPEDAERSALLARLGIAEVRHDPQSAASHLRAVLAGEENVRVRAALVPHLAEVLVSTGRAEAAVTLLDDLAGQIGEDDCETLYRLWAQGILVLLEETPHVADAWIARGNIADKLTGASPGQRLLLAALALKTTLTGQCAHTAADFADRALTRPGPAEEPALTTVFAAAALLHAGRLTDAARCCDHLLTDGIHRQPAPLQSLLMAMRAKIAHRTGDITSALSLGRRALALAPPGQRYQPYATAQAVHALLDLGAGDEAEQLCRASRQSPAGNHWSWATLHAARARNHHTQGNHHAALDELDACARLMRTGGYDNPALVPWRSHTALVHQRLGNHDAALELADEELVRARRWGAPHTIATSLRILGRLQSGVDAVTVLSEAASLLEGTPARRALAHTLTDLGEALHAIGRPSEARTPLRQALDLADASGAAPLSERAYRALLATGARPRRRRQSGVGALTGREHRIASLAATGMDNQAIASALFISRRTVEFHLTHVYRKLAIEGRAELATTLTAAPAHLGTRRRLTGGSHGTTADRDVPTGLEPRLA